MTTCTAPARLDQHPAVILHDDQRQRLAADLTAARDRLEALFGERYGLSEPAMKLAIRRGRANQHEIAARIAALDVEIDTARVRVRELEQAVTVADQERRNLVRRLRRDRVDQLADECRPILMALLDHFAQIEALSAQLESHRHRGADLPVAPWLAADLARTYRTELRSKLGIDTEGGATAR